MAEKRYISQIKLPGDDGITCYIKDSQTAFALTSLKQEIDYIHPLSITSFSVSPSVAEKGSTVNEQKFTFSANRKGTTFKIGDTEFNSSPATLNEQVTANKTYTLTAILNSLSKTSTATINFYNGIYYGVNSTTTASQEVITALSKKLQSGRSTSFTVNAGSGQYILFALPVSYGTPSFKVGGFDGGFKLSGSTSFTNSSGYSEDYNLYQSVNASLGNTTVSVS